VKRVTSALIHCCYSPLFANGEASDGVRGRDSFLALCGDMTMVDGDFASSVFPAVVFDLLQSGEGSVEDEDDDDDEGGESDDDGASKRSNVKRSQQRKVSRALRKTRIRATTELTNVHSIRLTLASLRRRSQSREQQSARTPPRRI